MNWTRSEHNIYRTIGALIAARRRACELTQADIAHVAGLTRQNIANIEGGRQRVQVHTLIAIADTLMIDPGKLLP